MNASQFFCTGCGHRLQAGKRFCTICGKQARVIAPAIPTTNSGALPAGMVMGGRWQVIRQLGKGGMGAVYLVHDTRLNNRRAALKEMLDRSLTLGAREEAIDRFNREAETLASLNHANVPHIYDRFTEADRIYMVMEFIDGMDLERLLIKFQEAHGTPLPERVVARHTYQLCSVLDYIHRQTPPTLHRDLKPSNIIFQTSGLVKLIDFGIAKVFNPGSQGTGLGTQGYAGPEQYKGLAEPRTDLYALGATLHHLLTGRDPQLETPFDFPRVSQMVQVSAGLDEIVTALLEMRPENRPESAGEVRRRLTELYPGIHEWDEDARILQLVGARPRTVTRSLPAAAVQAPAPIAPAPVAPPLPTPAPSPAYDTPPPLPPQAMQAVSIQSAPPPLPAPAPAPVAAAPVNRPKFCTRCGGALIPGAKFCTGCGNVLQASAPLVPPAPPSVAPAPVVPAPQAPPPAPAALSLKVPGHLTGSAPLELLAFDDTAEPYCLLGVVQIGSTEYAFVTPGPNVAGGAPVDVYLQTWQGTDALFEPAPLDKPGITAEIDAAWRALQEQS